jgi:hypothetical protein
VYAPDSFLPPALRGEREKTKKKQRKAARRPPTAEKRRQSAGCRDLCFRSSDGATMKRKGKKKQRLRRGKGDDVHVCLRVEHTAKEADSVLACSLVKRTDIVPLLKITTSQQSSSSVVENHPLENTSPIPQICSLILFISPNSAVSLNHSLTQSPIKLVDVIRFSSDFPKGI